jgi:hypothetical protein
VAELEDKLGHVSYSSNSWFHSSETMWHHMLTLKLVAAVNNFSSIYEIWNSFFSSC